MAATPILNREQPAPDPQKPRHLKHLVIGGIIGAVIAPFVPSAISHVSLVWLLAIIPVYYLVILFHELGHVAAGLTQGFDFRELAVGPLVLSRRSAGLRFRFVPGNARGGGRVLAVPDSPRDLRRRFQIMLAGGPIATALVFACLPFLPLNPLTGGVILCNTLIAASSWLPFYISGSVTDAKGILILSRPGADGDWLAAILYLLALDAQGTLPCQWPADTVAQLASPGNSPPAACALYCALIYALDSRDPDRIAAALEQVLAASANLRPDLRRNCYSEAAYFHGVVRRNAPMARAWLDDARKIKGTAAEEDWDKFGLAAIAIAEDQPGQARECISRAIALLDRHAGNSGSVAAARARLVGQASACPAPPA